ncbi:N-acyl homoserine lactonase family protein [Mucilaginibacter sp.]|uniref:N-acyl homoserine lactonase family protein n=1 Tax=Mucilaginibacter sp. TaxID=1882438 RepID=UPI0025D02154|nr:N-acyl homoserine lactonase family protein [Mucilaginibacter sp.]
MITPENFRLRFRLFVLVLLLSITGGNVFSQSPNYQIYALKFASLNFKVPIAAMAVGSASKDSTGVCYMIYLLKGDNGKLILVDAGFTEPIKPYPSQAFTYIRPDSMLMKININPRDITDVIITHPHWDHIGGIDLFPNAMVWMQKEDFNYFVGAAWQKGEDPNNGFNPIDVNKIIEKNLTGKLNLVKGDSVEITPGVRVFIGSKHTFECQYVLVVSGAAKVIIASDNSYLYYNLANLLSIPITLDQKAYLQNLKRMRGMVKNIDLILPGHDPLVFSKFPKVTDGVVKIK